MADGIIPGLVKGLATTARSLTRHTHTAEYPDVSPALPPRSRGVIALTEENCTSCMLCARECPDWCIYIDSHKEELPATTPGGRARQRNVLDRFAIDFSLCMYCGICIEVCPFDALHWSPEFEYAEIDIRDLLHEKDRLGAWMATVPAPPALDPGSADPAEVTAAAKPARGSAGAAGCRWWYARGRCRATRADAGATGTATTPPAPDAASDGRQAQPATEAEPATEAARHDRARGRSDPGHAGAERTAALPVAERTATLPAAEQTSVLPPADGAEAEQAADEAAAQGDSTQVLPTGVDRRGGSRVTTRDIVFTAVGAVTALSALLSVTTKQVVHAALWLLVSLGSLAGAYLVLGQELVGLVQLLVYVGAIVVLVLFALMLTRAPIGPHAEIDTPRWQRVAGALLGAATTALLASLLLPLFSGRHGRPRHPDDDHAAGGAGGLRHVGVALRAALGAAPRRAHRRLRRVAPRPAP